MLASLVFSSLHMESIRWPLCAIGYHLILLGARVRLHKLQSLHLNTNILHVKHIFHFRISFFFVTLFYIRDTPQHFHLRLSFRDFEVSFFAARLTSTSELHTEVALNNYTLSRPRYIISGEFWVAKSEFCIHYSIYFTLRVLRDHH